MSLRKQKAQAKEVEGRFRKAFRDSDPTLTRSAF
jgi:hypothetical protein